MRPISIRISAFGPYAGEVDIPMEDLGTEGLYLITGNTGAGKTTIFDAICYALFGKASGDNREANMLRSKYADPSIPTEVDLTFIHAGKEYRVKRNPEYERPKKSGEGTTIQKTDAELHLPNGDVISKVTEVDKAIKEILAIDCDQFTQIVMLAQGNFADLLLADTKERKEIFREIFKTMPYLRLEKKIGEQVKEVREKSERLNDSIKQYIRGIQVDEEDELSIAVEKAKDGEMMTEDVISLVEKLVDKDEKKKEKLEKEIEANDKILEKIIANVNTAETIEVTKKSLANVEEELKEETPKLDAFKKTLDTAKAASKDKDKFNKEAGQLEKDLASYDAVETLKVELDDLNEKRVNKTEEKDNIKAQLDASQDELTELKKEQTALKDSKTELEKQKISFEKVNKSIEELKELESSVDNLKLEKTNHEKYLKDYNKADEDFKIVNAEYERLEQLFRDGQAGVLASKLKEGEKCPVCGSTKHPSLAQISDEIPSQKELDDSKKKAQKARDLRESAAMIVKGSNKTIETLEKELKKQLNKQLGINNIEEGSSKINNAISSKKTKAEEIKKNREKSERQVDRLKELDKKIPKMEKEIDGFKTSESKLNEELTSISTTMKEKEKQLNEKKKDLKFENRDVAQSKMDELLEKVQSLCDAEDKAEKEYNEQKTLITEIETKIKEYKKTVESAKNIDLKEESEKQDKYTAVRDELREADNNLEARLQSNRSTFDNLKQKSVDAIDVEERLQWMDTLSKTASGQLKGKERIALETYVQSTYFDRIIHKANVRFMDMSGGQYELRRKEEASGGSSQSGLELNIVDHNNASERSVKSLSGGEKFMASLSLALGLSDEIQSTAGGIQIDTMFVDEGFGSLDQNALDQAFRALSNLSNGNKLVGIISHVEALKDRIDKKIIVEKDKTGGSKVTMSL